MAVSLCPITPEDEAFLFEVYARNRMPELARVPWTDDQKHAFLTFQFQAQHQYYREEYAGAAFHLIVRGDTPLGRLYVDRRDDEIRILDVTLLPAYRGQGIGSRLIRALLDEAEQAGKPVRIYVETYQPSVHLFERLGFAKIEDHGVSYLMEWRPAAAGD
ncbi:MAG: GNAT family N-acetyltransferase [Rhodothermales bacterium]